MRRGTDAAADRVRGDGRLRGVAAGPARPCRHHVERCREFTGADPGACPREGAGRVDSIEQAEPKQTGPRWCDSMDLLNAARTRMRAAADQRHAGVQVDAAAFAVDQRQAESALADMVAAAPDSVATHLPTVRDYFADNVADIARYVTAGSGPYALLDQIDEPERQALAALQPGLTACRASTP